MEKRKMYRDPETGLLFLAPLIGMGVKAAAKAAAKRQNQEQFAPQQQALAAQQAQLVAQQAQLKQQQQALQAQQQQALKASIAQARTAPVPATTPTALAVVPAKSAGFSDVISKASTPTGALAAGVLGAGAGYLYAGEKPMTEKVKFAVAGGLGGYILLLNLPMIYSRVTGQPMPGTATVATAPAATPAAIPTNLPRLPSVPEMLQMSDPVYNGMWGNVLALYQQAGVDITPYQATKAKVDILRRQPGSPAGISGVHRRR